MAYVNLKHVNKFFHVLVVNTGKSVDSHASFVHTNCSELLLSAKFPFWEFLNLNLLRFTVCRKSDCNLSIFA